MEMKTEMGTNELLQAILSELHTIRAEAHERFEKLEAGQTKLETEVSCIRRDLQDMSWKIGVLDKGMSSVRQEAQDISWKLNILYNWVDEMNLKAKRLGRDH